MALERDAKSIQIAHWAEKKLRVCALKWKGNMQGHQHARIHTHTHMQTAYMKCHLSELHRSRTDRLRRDSEVDSSCLVSAGEWGQPIWLLALTRPSFGHTPPVAGPPLTSCTAGHGCAQKSVCVTPTTIVSFFFPPPLYIGKSENIGILWDVLVFSQIPYCQSDKTAKQVNSVLLN